MAPHAEVKFDRWDGPGAAAALAKSSQVAIVFAVQHESEGMDLPNLSLPDHQDALIEAVAAANPHTIVVLETGGAVLMPWIDQVSARAGGVVSGDSRVGGNREPSLRGGQPVGTPSADVSAERSRSAASDTRAIRRSPMPIIQLPKLAGLPGVVAKFMGIGPDFDVHYDEGLKVGYKWYDAEKKPVLFPFGFGLSYTTLASSRTCR